ncbi:MAG: hypothetical protein ACREOD_04725 [Candidatus Dormibacteria bacterium]
MSPPGFTDQGQRDLRQILVAQAEEGRGPGFADLVARGDRVHVEVLGRPSLENWTPLPRDALFRIVS